MADDVVVMEEREALIVPPTGGYAFVRKAHFLKPTASSVNGAVAARRPSCSAAPPAAQYKSLPFKVDYHGWKPPQENWKKWVDRLQSTHHLTWRKAGIFDAVMASKCIIHRYDDLILELAEKWYPKTNSLVFSWGEATITLEDVMVLGAFSLMGESVLGPFAREEEEETMQKLLKARREICRSNAKSADKGKWIAKFMDSGSDIEHEAFLVYWLSRFVFPRTAKTIGNSSVFSIAVRLSRGNRVALGPSVLASIYRSLTVLKAALMAARKSWKSGGKDGEILHVALPGMLALVQVWVWERFPTLRPKPVSRGGPRLARWHNLKLGSEYRSMTMDSAGKDFLWRPYSVVGCNVCPGMVYKSDERWVVVDSDLDEDLEGYVRCLRTSELVSLEGDCIEQYLPHRVARQFGMDQDLPGRVARVNANAEVAWNHYNRPISDAEVYVPPGLSEACTTSLYSTWWKSSVTGSDGKSSDEDSGTEIDLFGSKSEADFFSPPPGFSLKWKKVREGRASGMAKWGSPICSSTGNDSGKGCSRSSQKRRKHYVSSSEESDCSESEPPAGGKGSTKSSTSSQKRRKLYVSSSEESDYSESEPPAGGKGSSKSSKKPKKLAESFSVEKLDYKDLSDVPPGFAPKHRPEKEIAHPSSSGSYVHDQPEGNALGKYPNDWAYHSDKSDNDAQGNVQNDCSRNDASSPANNGEVQEKTLLNKPDDEGMLTDEAPMDRMDEKSCKSPSEVQGNASEPPVIELEEMIATLEKLMALMKEGKLFCLR